MTFEQRDTIGFHAAQLARLIANRLRDALTPLGLMPAQVAALIEIGRAEGLTQKELVERLDVEQPGVARTLNGLEADGWITRQTRAGRSQGLYLTDQARAVVPEAARLSDEINRNALNDLSKTERAHLIDRLGEVIAGLKTA